MKKHTATLDPCWACGGRTHRRRVDEVFHVRGRPILVRNVPVDMCRACGEKVAWAAVGKRVEALLRGDRGRMIRIRALDYEPGAPAAAPRRRAAN